MPPEYQPTASSPVNLTSPRRTIISMLVETVALMLPLLLSDGLKIRRSFT